MISTENGISNRAIFDSAADDGELDMSALLSKLYVAGDASGAQVASLPQPPMLPVNAISAPPQPAGPGNYYVQQQQQQQQQPVYLDPSGQPIYYRVAPTGQQAVPAPQQAPQPAYQYQDPYAGSVQGYSNAGYQDSYNQASQYRGGGRNQYESSARDDGMNGGYGGGYNDGYRGGGGGRDSYQRGGGRHDSYGDYRDDYRDNRRNRRDDYRRDDRGGAYGSYSNSTGSNPGKDPLVDEFRSTFGKSRPWGLRDVEGHVVAFCQDQHGSRFIQQRLEVCSDAEKQIVFDEILPVANPLMIDVFGNYVLQKLFEYGAPEQVESLALLVTGQAVDLAMQSYGCRVVQKAMEYSSTQRLLALVAEFENPPVLLRCVHDSNGNHVIQKIIEIVSRVARDEKGKEQVDYLTSRIQFIIDIFLGRVKELCTHPYGCRVVQRILEHCPIAQKAAILEELRQHCSELVQDCYGNYVIQFVMQHGWEADRAVLIREVKEHLLDFSQHKFASNVVEKCLQYASRRDRDEMVWSIINYTFDASNPVDNKGHCVLESMVRDPYANYVVQKVIDVSDERQRAAILRYVRENIAQLRRYTYGKHIIVRLEKLTNEKF